jgi:hypothetical protein
MIKLKIIVQALLVLSVIAFLTGFLQYTEFEFVIYIFYFILFAVGVNLVIITLKSTATRVVKGFLLLTGFSSTVYFLFFVFAVIRNLLSDVGITEIMESVEGILYLTSLAFLIGAIGSIVLLKMNKTHSNQPIANN